jgi:hypothetical protein
MANVRFISAKKGTFRIIDNSVFKCKEIKRAKDYEDSEGNKTPTYYIGSKPISDTSLNSHCQKTGVYPAFLIYGEPLELETDFTVSYSEKSDRYMINFGFESDVDMD